MKPNKEVDYFVQIMKHSEIAMKSLKLLEKRMLNTIAPEEKNIKLQIAELEIVVEHNLNEITGHLVKEFLPPMDREDLIMIMNGITELVYQVINQLRMWEQFRISYIRFDVTKLIKCIMDTFELLYSAVKELSNFKKSTTLITTLLSVKKKVQQGNLVLLDIKYFTYKSSMDSRDMFLWNQVFDGIKSIMSCYDRLSNLLEIAVVRNS